MLFGESTRFTINNASIIIFEISSADVVTIPFGIEDKMTETPNPITIMLIGARLKGILFVNLCIIVAKRVSEEIIKDIRIPCNSVMLSSGRIYKRQRKEINPQKGLANITPKMTMPNRPARTKYSLVVTSA